MAVSDKDDEDFDPHPTYKVGSSKLKRSLDSKMKAEKRRRNRVWSEKDELTLVNGFREYNSLYPNREISLHNYVKHRISFEVSVNQLADKLRRMKKKYEETNSRRMKGDFRFKDPHQQRLFEASAQIWGGSNSWIKSEAVSEEGEDFYYFLLDNYMADKGLDSASLDDATLKSFVEEWRDVMLAETYLDVLAAEFERKVCGCKRHVYKAYFKTYPTPGRS